MLLSLRAKDHLREVSALALNGRLVNRDVDLLGTEMTGPA
jgi:hypothetical protein